MKQVSKDTPVIKISNGITKDMEKGSGSNKYVSEPIEHRFSGGDGIIRGGGIDLRDVGLTVWTIIYSKHGNFARVKLLDPLGRLKKPIADRNSERRVVVVVLNISFW